VAIGNFDGVHLGHRAVLGQAVATARASGLRPLVLTFHPHPSEVLGRGPLPRLTNLERKVELLQRTSEELHVVVHRFDLELASLAPERFVEELLVRPLGAAIVQVGTNFRFGKGRAGDLATLAELGARHGFEARSEPLFGDEAGSYSSTRVRQVIAAGDVVTAARLLGRPHMLSGVVVQGDQRGRTLGFPTANLAGIVEARPPHGVYAVLVDAEASPGRFTALARGVMNVGVRPTFAAGESCEVHLLDFAGDLYGRRLRVHLVERIRGEQRFSGVEELKAQVSADVQGARRALPEQPPASGAWF
jgi:riboflavin kinase/FMN adenylyltransferase